MTTQVSDVDSLCEVFEDTDKIDQMRQVLLEVQQSRPGETLEDAVKKVSTLLVIVCFKCLFHCNEAL